MPAELHVAFLALLAVLGLVFGSFANVVIWRFPRGESISDPPSHCPKCGHAVRWHDNIPIISWLVLRARCRDCGNPISPRYPLVELASGGLWLLAGALYGFSPRTFAAIVLFYLLLILALIDLDTMRLPNPLVGLLVLVGLVFAVVAQFTSSVAVPLTWTGMQAPSSPLSTALAGMLLGGGVSLAVALVYAGVRRASGFGMGDVKLLGALGLYLGPYVLMVLFFGSLIGAVVGIILASASQESLRTKKIPFGPMLAIATLVTVVTGPAIWNWYAVVTGLA